MSAFVVTGTDGGIGKTVICAAIAGAIGASYWKPVQYGLEEAESRAVAALARMPETKILPPSYRVADAAALQHGAVLEAALDPDNLRLPDVRPLVIEGGSGALVPLSREVTYADVFAQWGLLSIVVARTAPGTINHSLLTIEALRARRVPIHGVAFVGDADEASEAAIAEIGQVRRLGRLPNLPDLTARTLAAAFARGFSLDDFV